jgi:hypothetical protein
MRLQLEAKFKADDLIRRFKENYGLDEQKAIEAAKTVASGKFLELLLLSIEENSDTFETKYSKECTVWEYVVDIYGAKY